MQLFAAVMALACTTCSWSVLALADGIDVHVSWIPVDQPSFRTHMFCTVHVWGDHNVNHSWVALKIGILSHLCRLARSMCHMEELTAQILLQR
jgi:hypothetical protein